MKKIFVIMLFFISVSYIQADQLQWITKDQAKETYDYFKEHGFKQIILWCACCDNDLKMLVNVKDFSYKPASDPNFYEFYITGETYDGKTVNQSVDLAYVHIMRGSKWRCLGKELGFECDPCTKAFKF